MSARGKFLLLFFILLIASLVIFSFFSQPKKYVFFFQRENLESIVKSELEEAKGRYGIYIKNLKTSETFTQKGEETFSPGSLYKLWVMAAVFQNIKDGKLKEDDDLPANIGKLNSDFNIAPSEAELKGGVIKFSVKSALEQMITISHNYAALALTQKVGLSALKNVLKEYGLKNSEIGDNPKTTSLDLGKFFEKLYRGEIVDQESSQKMLDLLSRQTINDRIPKYLPPETKVAHKTGDLGYFENDGGIVFSPGGDFIIIVLTETDSPEAAADKIGKLTESVYRYFNK